MSSPAPNRHHQPREWERSAVHSIPQSHSGESSRSGVLNQTNKNLHRPLDTQAAPRFQREFPIHVDPNLHRSMNAQASQHSQGGAPMYSDPIPHHPSDFQRRPAQQENLNESGRRRQPVSPQLVAGLANSRPFLQNLDSPIRSVTEDQRRERPPSLIVADISDSEDIPGRQRSPSPPPFRDRRHPSSNGGKKSEKQHYYVRPPQASLFKSSKMDRKSTEKSKTDPGKRILDGLWEFESGISQRGTKNSKAWKPAALISKSSGWSWASGDEFLTRKKTRKVENWEPEKKHHNHTSRHYKDH